MGDLRPCLVAEVSRWEGAGADARELHSLRTAQCDAIESHNLSVEEMQNKAKLCYRAVQSELTSEAKKRLFEAHSDDSDNDEAPLVTKKLPSVPLWGFIDYEFGMVHSNPHKADIKKVDAQSVLSPSEPSRKSTLLQYAA